MTDHNVHFLINGILDGTLTTIEFQREALENAQSNTEILKNMGMASKALKGALGNMDIDKVDDMMADIQESQDVSNEIADAIARPMGFQVIFHRRKFQGYVVARNRLGGYRFFLIFRPQWPILSVPGDKSYHF